MSVGVLEIFFVLFVVLLILGPRRIADLGRALGRGVRDFKLEFSHKAAGYRRTTIGKEREADDNRREPVTSKGPDKEL
jgi:Sec-independent protein translocase protein TatA